MQACYGFNARVSHDIAIYFCSLGVHVSLSLNGCPCNHQQTIGHCFLPVAPTSTYFRKLHGNLSCLCHLITTFSGVRFSGCKPVTDYLPVYAPIPSHRVTFSPCPGCSGYRPDRQDHLHGAQGDATTIPDRERLRRITRAIVHGCKRLLPAAIFSDVPHPESSNLSY